MTSQSHTSGSDRIAECAEKLGWANEQLVVNLQGDEPLMPAECLEQVARLLASDSQSDAASLYWPAENENEITDPNVVKVVLDELNRALMFSRSPIPYPRDFDSITDATSEGLEWKRHLGLYAFRVESLRKFSHTTPTPLERCEHLEQLRILESGGKMVLARACSPIPAGVDTQEDLDRVRNCI